MVIDSYNDALNYLYSFIDYGSTHAESLSPHKFDLQRMEQFMDLLGDPHEAYRIVHVAGTKGKGSVCALCANAVAAAGYRVGLYTSPHLEEFTERIQVDNQPITRKQFVKCVNDVKSFVEQISGITFFEITTAIAFYHFQNLGVELAVIEVGLGGRLDATNVVRPDVSVITSLSYDHTYVLGDTLSQIAFEKGGIIKEGVPVIMAPQVDAARNVIHELGLSRNSRVIDVSREVTFDPFDRDLHGQSFRMSIVEGSELSARLAAESHSADLLDMTLQIPLLGSHQIENAMVAFATLVVLRSKGMKIDVEAIQSGFASVEWPGRFEVYSHQPMLVLDSAHNKHSARVLCNALEDYVPEGDALLIFGASGDKDIGGMLEVLNRESNMFLPPDPPIPGR